MLHQVIYSSKAAEPMSAASLQKILDDARTGNEARDITGALVYADGVFLQILEGEKGIVRYVMENIERDTRHHSVKIFFEADVEARAFESFRMAYLTPSTEEMSDWAGLEGTATIDSILAHVHQDMDRMPRILVSIVEALAS